MNLSITIPNRLRLALPAWLLLLLLPVLPGVVLVGTVSDGNLLSDAGVVAGFDLLAGGVLALAIPFLLRFTGWPIRKEVEQLRGPWIACLFLLQVPMLFAPDGTEFTLILYGATCALLASIPFGAEFQQRTLPGLLSLPSDRLAFWRRKMGVLLAALFLHAVLTASTLLVQRPSPADSGLTMAVYLVVAPLLAACTAPWWSLVTRAILPATVFSFATPLAFLFVLALGFEAWKLVQPPELVQEFEARAAITYTSLVTPTYAILAAWSTRRRWLRLETPDFHALDSGGVFGGRFGNRSLAANRPRRHSPLRSLLLKELRLQTVTWVVVGIALALTLLGGLANPLEWSYFTRQYLAGTGLLFAGIAVLVAAATAIAEERRLGTLDPQVLLPVSRAAQWWIKLGVVAAITLVMYFCSVSILGDFIARTPLGLALALGFACLTLFTSSASANTLRALLGAIPLLVAAVTVVSLTFTMVDRDLAAIWQQRGSIQYDSGTDISRALELGESRIAGLRAGLETVGLAHSAGLALLYLAAFGLGALALFFSWRNFSAPAGRTPWRQIALWLAALVACAAGLGFGAGAFARAANRNQTLVLAWDTHRFRESLPPAQLRLAQHALGGRLPLGTTLHFIQYVWVDDRPALPRPGPTPPPDAPPAIQPAHWEPTSLELPLSPTAVQRLVERAWLPDDLRETLRVEAGLPVPSFNIPSTPPGSDPSVPPGATFPMSPELMRRYGLIGTATPTRQSTTSPLPPVQMTPDLMRRYGLLPRNPKTTNLPPASVPAPVPSP